MPVDAPVITAISWISGDAAISPKLPWTRTVSNRRPLVCKSEPDDTRDLIIWQRAPRLQDSAFEVGDADLVHCKPTLDTWGAEQPAGPGYCSKIAWASDNPSYDVDVRPAPPLKKVIDEVGDC
jgi:hypothetical protein